MKQLKYNFWTFQITGWLLFCIYDIWSNPSHSVIISEWPYFFFWLRSMIILFLLTLLLRLVCRLVFNQTNKLFYYIIFIFLSSFIFSFLWLEIREFKSVIFPSQVMAKNIILYTKDRLSSDYYYRILFGSWVFLVWALLYFGVRYWQELFTERIKSKEALILAQNAQLQMLRNQLNPHFLFNSLNSIQGLIYKNQGLADSMISELSEFLRYSLKYNTMVFVPVREELEILKKYLSIEKIRFDERLEYKIDADISLLDHEIPCFIAQPLVENSIKHGLSNNPVGIKILIKVYRSDRYLRIEVANTGSLLSASWTPGIGIRNILERLENMYPEKHSFSLSEEEDLVKATIQIPLSK